MYNARHAKTLDHSLPYVDHSYKRALHIPTGHSPFQVGLGFQPLCLIDVAMPHATTQVESTHVISNADKETRFIECI